MLDHSLPVRNEMMAARSRWTIPLVAELFPVGVRFSGSGTATNLGQAASMRTARLIASVLVARTHWPPAPTLFMVLCATLAFVASFGRKHASGGGA